MEQENITMLMQVEDRLSGFAGTVVSISENAYSNMDFLVQPSSLHNGMPVEPRWCKAGQLRLPGTETETV